MVGFQSNQFITPFGTRSEIALGDMNDEQYNDFVTRDRKARERLNEIYGFSQNQFSNNSNTGTSGTTGGSNNSGGSSNANNFLGIGFGGGIDGLTQNAKDLAEFRLGLDFRGMDKAAGLRETESANNFGRTTKLTDQTFDWQRLINNDTQGAMTQRNTDTLQNQRQLQSADLGFQDNNIRRAIGLASRRLGS